MFDSLLKYKHTGVFSFSPTERLQDKCNAPKTCSGIYIVKQGEELIYIGRSGRMLADGTICHRKGGIYDRLVNGHQFAKKARKHTWPLKMREEDIPEISVTWYDTELDDPCKVEYGLLCEYEQVHGVLPRWNKTL